MLIKRQMVMSFNKAEQLWNEEQFSIEKDGRIEPMISLRRLMILYQPLCVHGVNINRDWGWISVKRGDFSGLFRESDKIKKNPGNFNGRGLLTQFTWPRTSCLTKLSFSSYMDCHNTVLL